VSEHIWIRVAGKRLWATVTQPAEGSVRAAIMVHGGPGGSQDGPGGLFAKLAERLAGEGIGSLRFDMLGEGLSEGDYRDLTLRSQAEQLAEVLRFARSKVTYYERVCVVCESLGATALLLQTRWPPDIQTAVLLWPAIYPQKTSLSEYLTPERLGEAAAVGYVHDDRRLIAEGFLLDVMSVGNLHRFVRALDVPVLLMHGDADSEVPVFQSLDARLPPASRLVVVPGGGHGLLRPEEQQLVLDQAVEWICAKL
jgi:uncharacterized protein